MCMNYERTDAQTDGQYDICVCYMTGENPVS